MHKLCLALLLLANVMVLLGQLWPEGAPPFAHTANVATLTVNVLLLVLLLVRGKRSD